MPTGRKVVVDTHALIWWQAGSDRLSARAGEGLRAADQIVVPSICCWEVSMLVGKQRISLDRPVVDWMSDLLANPTIVAADLTPTIATQAGLLDEFHGDPADRFIVATATDLGLPLITKDQQLHAFAQRTKALTTIW